MLPAELVALESAADMLAKSSLTLSLKSELYRERLEMIHEVRRKYIAEN